MKQKFNALSIILITAFMAGASLSSYSQGCADLFFSEYLEGSSNNKCLEIYNPTPNPINLTTGAYKIIMYFNGSTSAGLTINLTGTVAPYGVFVVCQSGAAAALLALANQTNASGWYNGNDAVALVKGAGNTPVDIIGQIGVDPGAEWGTGLTSTADNTLRRKFGITAGDTNGADAFNPALEWDGFANDTFNGIGSHSSACAPPPTCGISSITVANISACNDNGTPLSTSDDFFTANVTVSYTGRPDSGQLVLSGSGSASVAASATGLSSYTFNNVVMPANGAAIVLTATFSQTPACTFTNLNAGTAPGSCSVIPPCSLPFFSEYIEGSGNNKCLEIYNPTGSPIDLAAGGYRIRMYFNGNNAAGLTINLIGIVAPGGTFVICNSGATANFLAFANQTNSAGWYNGDDAVALENNNGVLDVIGQIGVDPGTSWSNFGVSTENQTLRRYGFIAKGDNDGTDAFDPSMEWAFYPQDAFNGLGYHLSTCPNGLPGGWAPANPGCASGTTTFSGNTFTQTSSCYNPNPGQDDLTFALKELCGDGEIVAQYMGVTPFGFAGLMMRSTAASNSPYVWMFMRANNQAYWSIRNAAGGTPLFDQKPHLNRLWMKLNRSGNVFRGYLSTNGSNWQLVFQSALDMDDCLLVGIATHSNVDGNMVTSMFKNVNITGTGNSFLAANQGGDPFAQTLSIGQATGVQTGAVPAGSVPLADQFAVWPNPAGQTLEITLPRWDTGQPVEIQVNDIQGRPLLYRRLDDQGNRLSLDLSSLSPGMYLLTARSGEHLEITRFIKK